MTTTTTPMMAQWESCKSQAKEALLFFRLGDFYEAFHEDAKLLSKELNLTLTARQNIPMCGIPFHTAEIYIDKLIAKGYKVAIAEQTDDPKNTKGLLKREVTQIVTPGTIVSSKLLKEKRNNFFASITQVGSIFGLSFIDLTTGEFWALELESKQDLLDEISRLKPAEFLVNKRFIETHPHFFTELSHTMVFILNTQDDVDPKIAGQTLTAHFDVHHLDEFGLRGQIAAINAGGSLLLYLKEELNLDLEHITSVHTEPLAQYMSLDRVTLRHLELTESIAESGSKNTLLDFLDQTCTPMGGRLLHHWITHPLFSCVEIKKRQEGIDAFLKASHTKSQMKNLLEQIRDIDRLIIKISAHMGGPRDLYALATSLSHLPELKTLCHSLLSTEIQALLADIFEATPLFTKILHSMNENPPLRVSDGEIFRKGVHLELDQLKDLSQESMHWMAKYQSRLREETGIKTLKVGYTRAFGYYIEISRAHADKTDKIPPSFQRKQTLTNGDRFITEELKEFEHKVLTAEERSKAIEMELFENLRQETTALLKEIQKTAKALAKLDALFCLATIADQYGFVCPTIDDSDRLEICEGRHPIVEKWIGKASFIANDTHLSSQKQMMLITGPNMAGKSTYIRQVALIVILAQMGSYVPAKSAHIGLIDKVFSRIGASDDLARGQSTFMIEMTETANILNHATSRSLVLLDEIGRGTSTYDGISIAWAVAEFLLTSAKRQAKTLFATHYWELTRLEIEYPHAMNFQTAVEEIASGVVFLRKIVKGGTDKSYGIHVAKLAGLPPKVLRRAEEMLVQLETKSRAKKEIKDEQLSLFSAPKIVEHPLIEELKGIDINGLTPLAALQKISQWQEML
jgi:DNA mismatch repair protein MutS